MNNNNNMLTDRFFNTTRNVASYVLNIAYVEKYNQVVAVLKNRPSWQAGRYNLAGGKIEPGENAFDAVARETGEEMDVWLPHSAFRPVAVLERIGDFEMFVFASNDPQLENARTMTDEIVAFLDVKNMIQGEYATLKNLPWLFGLAFDGSSKIAHVVYN